MRRPGLVLLLAFALTTDLAACRRGMDQAATAAAPRDAGVQPASAEPPPRHAGRPLPAFSGWTLDDQRLDVSALLGKRVLLVFFDPDVKDAEVAVSAARRIADLRGKQNFEIVGVATGTSRDRARALATRLSLPFPILDDSGAKIAQRLGLRAPVALLGVDAEGYVTFGLPEFAASEPNAGRSLEELLREALRLPPLEAPPGDGAQPNAPPFRAAILDRNASFDLAAQRGHPVVLVFFLHTCPHCHEALRALKTAFADPALAGLPEAKRPVLVGVEITGRSAAVRDTLKSDGLDFFPVVFDDDGKLRDQYSVFGGVPDIFLIDAEGRITARSRGWSPPGDEALVRMRLARLAGIPVPMLLRADGYSGNAVCGVCHELEHETWGMTQHAGAYDTLVRHGEDGNGECIGCHVVGWGRPGGFRDAVATPELENVGCESCHGRGGPHQSPGFVKGGDYAPACAGCHDPKHSLGFEVATFLPRISHAANAAIAKLPPEEKRQRLASRGRPSTNDLLPVRADYVGSNACKSCHAAEFATWASGPHARAGATLAHAGKGSDAACLHCHTTGFDRAGGFPSTAAASAQPDLGRVGCESCHGPGGDHVKDGATKIGSVLALGDKCDSCVILQICGDCHDEANDPGFEFEVKAKIDQQRHGTIEPGTGRPKSQGTARRDGSDAALLADALGLSGSGS